MKSGSRVVIHYSSMHEKTLPNGSIRCRMELHRASLASTQWPWATQDPRPPRDPKRRLLPPKEWLPVAPAPSRLPSLAPRLSLFQKMAYRWHLGEDQPGYPRTPEGSLEQRSSAQRWRGGFPIGQEHRSGRRGARLRWWEEDQGQEAPHPGGHGGFRTQGEGPQRQGDGPRGDQDATAAGRYAISPPPSSVAGRRLPWGGQGQGLGREGLGMERRSPRACAQGCPRRGPEVVGQGVGQRGRGGRLAETIAP